MTRREYATIVGDILLAIEAAETDANVPANPTQLAARANVAFDRLMSYLDQLHFLGFISGDRYPKVTPRGKEFLASYRTWVAALERFGLTRLHEGLVDDPIPRQ